MKLRWFIVALVIMWALWVVTGGYTERRDSADKPFITEPDKPFDSGRPYTYQEFKNKY